MGLNQDLNYCDDIYIHNCHNGMLPGGSDYVYYDLVPRERTLLFSLNVIVVSAHSCHTADVCWAVSRTGSNVAR